MMKAGEIVGGRYAIVRLLGEGAMGSVFEVRHIGTERRLAIKVIHRRLALDDGLVRRFQVEARAAGRVDSQHVATVLDVDVDRATQLPYIVLEYLVGEDMDALLERTGALPPALAVRIAAQACLGLEKAHAAGIVHRDVKPANLFLAEKDAGERIVKVLDFGIAKLGADETPGAALTRTGGLVGSPLYMSPEQARGVRDLDARTDVWSLGTVLYQMLAGEAPHARVELVGDLLIAICTIAPAPLSARAPWVSEAVARVVHGALEIDRSKRYESVAALRDALLAALPGGTAIAAGEVRGLNSEERGGRGAAAEAFARTEVAGGGADDDLLGTGAFLAKRGLLTDAGEIAAPSGAPADATVRVDATGSVRVDATASARVDATASARVDPTASIRIDATASARVDATESRAPAPPPPPPGPASPPTAAAAVDSNTSHAPGAISRRARLGAALAGLSIGGIALVSLFALQAGGGRGSTVTLATTGSTSDATSSDAPPMVTARATASVEPPGPSAAATGASTSADRAFRPCSDPRRGVRPPRSCEAPARSWCDGSARVVACCGMGLVPAGEEGTCQCAPGGTDDREALRSGCPARTLAQREGERAQATFRTAFPAFRRCYEEALAHSKSAAGGVKVFVEIGAAGHVLHADVETSSLPDPDAQKCLLRSIRSLQFDPPTNGYVQLQYPLQFSPGD